MCMYAYVPYVCLQACVCIDMYAWVFFITIEFAYQSWYPKCYCPSFVILVSIVRNITNNVKNMKIIRKMYRDCPINSNAKSINIMVE